MNVFQADAPGTSSEGQDRARGNGHALGLRGVDVKAPVKLGVIVTDHRQQTQAGYGRLTGPGAFFLLLQEQIARVSLLEMFNERFVTLRLDDTDAIADAHRNVVARELQMDSDRDLDIGLVILHRILKKLVCDVSDGVFNLILPAPRRRARRPWSGRNVVT